MDLPNVLKLGEGPEHGHVKGSLDFTRTIHMDIGSIYMVVKVPEYELKLLIFAGAPQTLICQVDTPCV